MINFINMVSFMILLDYKYIFNEKEVDHDKITFSTMINKLYTIIYDINMLVQSSFIEFEIIDLFNHYDGLIINCKQNNSYIHN
jgi:hypothetical protein